jgi:hypothetical protein
MPCKRALLLSFVMVMTTFATSALGQQDDAATRSAGRKLAQDGVALLQQGKAEQASEKLEKAYELLQVPSVALWSGRALVARGQWVEASERYVEASRLSGFKGDQQVQLQAQQDAARELESLTPRIPTLVIALPPGQGEKPAVTLDGKPVPTALLGEEQPVNPGTHQIKVTLGAKQTRREVTLAEAQKKRESITFEDAPSEPSTLAAAPSAAPEHDEGVKHPGMQRTLGFVALAAGGAGLIVGGVTGGLALSKHGALADGGQCAGDKCLPGVRSDVDSLDTLRTVSTIGFIAGGLLATTGVVLLLTTKPEGSASTVGSRFALRASPSFITLSGAF